MDMAGHLTNILWIHILPIRVQFSTPALESGQNHECRQLGLEFHSLQSELPLFDGETGVRVGEEEDRRVEVLRDALMDAARSRVEELGEDAVAGAVAPFSSLPPPWNL